MLSSIISSAVLIFPLIGKASFTSYTLLDGDSKSLKLLLKYKKQ